MPKEPLENCLVCSGTTRDDNVEIASVATTLESPCAKFKNKCRYFKELGKCKLLPPPSNMQAPILELKPLPLHLRYVFLGENDILPVIVNASLFDNQLDKLLRVLRLRKKAIRWIIADLRGISPLVCVHKILMKDNHKPVIKIRDG